MASASSSSAAAASSSAAASVPETAHTRHQIQQLCNKYSLAYPFAVGELPDEVDVEVVWLAGKWQWGCRARRLIEKGRSFLYKGRKMTKAALDELYGDDDKVADYAIDLVDKKGRPNGYVIDSGPLSAEYRNWACLVNDVKGTTKQPNLKLSSTDNTGYLVAEWGDIAAGTELLTLYGDLYWDKNAKPGPASGPASSAAAASAPPASSSSSASASASAPAASSSGAAASSSSAAAAAAPASSSGSSSDSDDDFDLDGYESESGRPAAKGQGGQGGTGHGGMGQGAGATGSGLKGGARRKGKAKGKGKGKAVAPPAVEEEEEEEGEDAPADEEGDTHDIDDDLKLYARQMHARARRRMSSYRQVTADSVDAIWGGDLWDLGWLGQEKNRYVLVMEDIFSRYCWICPCSNKDAPTLIRAFKHILEHSGGRKPQNAIWFAGEGAVKGKEMSAWLKKEKLPHVYTTWGVHGVANVERLLRTLSHALAVRCTEENSHAYLDFIDDIVEEYNNRPHSGLEGLSPAQASSLSADDQAKLWRLMYANPVRAGEPAKYKVGDFVLISRQKEGTFEKRGYANWGLEKFRITAVRMSSPPMYELEAYMGEYKPYEPITGAFYADELQPCPAPTADDVYPISEVLEKGTGVNKGRTKVAWLGWNAKHNSFEPDAMVKNLKPKGKPPVVDPEDNEDVPQRKRRRR